MQDIGLRKVAVYAMRSKYGVLKTKNIGDDHNPMKLDSGICVAENRPHPSGPHFEGLRRAKNAV